MTNEYQKICCSSQSDDCEWVPDPVISQQQLDLVRPSNHGVVHQSKCHIVDFTHALISSEDASQFSVRFGISVETLHQFAYFIFAPSILNGKDIEPLLNDLILSVDGLWVMVTHSEVLQCFFEPQLGCNT